MKATVNKRLDNLEKMLTGGGLLIMVVTTDENEAEVLAAQRLGRRVYVATNPHYRHLLDLDGVAGYAVTGGDNI